MDFMIGAHKFSANSIDEALLLAKKKMIEEGWRNLRLMIKSDDGWGVCRVIPSFETKY
ncbi:hypothetical protein P9294_gp093 [Bacillus phage FADO]|uniref:Uncharacterized protein n=1 Tax=Bacillus phage FADO TaxID=2917160 RepID=A0AAE9G5T4_9CAUD|nr:hypothetical protein P9294_gp093 [Bacillus phage FADO]UNY48808.1 hypothetical protein fado_93 [Bacillus phage FADO]